MLLYLVASIVVKPVFDKRLINSILTAAGKIVCSFCKPSLGPTSTIRTFVGRLEIFY